MTITPSCPLIVAENLARIYRRGAEEVQALAGVSFQIERKEFVAITGSSGSGKTTLLNLLGCMDSPTGGSLRLDGCELRELGERERTQLRRRQIGFVFQHFGLVPTLTVAENVALPAFFARCSNPRRVAALLEKVGLKARHHHRPHELSGGEMQRVAIARALINEPSLLLADEPTGNLDTATGETIAALFQNLHREGLTIIVATHNDSWAARAGRRLRLRDGRLELEQS